MHQPVRGKPLGYVQQTSLSSAVALASVPDGAVIVHLQAEAQDIRWRDDGTNPTATVGMVLKVGETMIYMGNFDALKFIEATASAKLNATYYR